MYLDHFGLVAFPFGITPDTEFVFSTSAHQEAFNALLVATSNGEGFVKITGEVGTGKTLLCRRYLNAMANTSAVTAYLPNPQLEPRPLLLAIAEELGVDMAKFDYQFHLLKSLNNALLEFAQKGRRVIVCLDEAQAMPIETLDYLRLLSNLETEKVKLLQVVLFGQPELDKHLENESIRQLRQRIITEYRLQGLSRSEVEHYLAHRARVAGYRGNGLFDATAVRRLHKASRGIPRVLNILAHKSLMAAFGTGKLTVGGAHALQAARDSESIAKRIGWWS
jgi:MSHA biogenesis protein MshM